MQIPLRYFDDPILRKKGAPITKITPEIIQLTQDMIDTMHAKNGMGLAAPQVNQSLALFVTQVPIKVSEDPEDHEWEAGEIRIYINPKILAYTEEKWVREEGCLSIPGVYGDVERPVGIKIRATDIRGNTFEEDLMWLHARVFMHENDHINGILYIDRIRGQERRRLDKALENFKKKQK